ncbi:MAG TPA: EF-hand domain-containing protein [Syntrophales bacterium]|nr:EF-hand domain-containing protein [Syntrophales bacterium]
MRILAIAAVIALCLSFPAFAEDFKAIDANKDGRISMKEFRVYVKQISPDKFKQLDIDGDGHLSKIEFAGDVDFKKVDKGKDGKINPREFTAYLVVFIAPSKFRSYDANRDWFISRKEFEAEQKNPVALRSAGVARKQGNVKEK